MSSVHLSRADKVIFGQAFDGVGCEADFAGFVGNFQIRMMVFLMGTKKRPRSRKPWSRSNSGR